MKDDLHFLRLWDLYSPLLTATQREITDLYFNYDLSLGEIAEQKGVSRQSVSDCLQKCRKQLESYEGKLQFAKALDELSREYSAYMTTVEHWMGSVCENEPTMCEHIATLQADLKKTHEEFGVEKIDLDNVVGKVFRENKEE